MTHLLASLVLFSNLAAPQDSIQLLKVFTVGEKERHSTKLSLKVAVGDVDVQLKTEQRVLKVFSNGDAELESELLDMKVTVNGEATPANQGGRSSAKFRVNAIGFPVQAPQDSGMGFNFLQFVGLVADKPLKPQVKTPVEWVNPNNSKQKAKGAITLESIADGDAKLVSTWEIYMPSSDKPLKIDMTSFVEIKTGKLKKASGTIVGASAQGTEVQAIQFYTEALP